MKSWRLFLSFCRTIVIQKDDLSTHIVRNKYSLSIHLHRITFFTCLIISKHLKCGKAKRGVLQKRIIIFNAKRKLKQWREPHFKPDFIIITTTCQMSELSSWELDSWSLTILKFGILLHYDDPIFFMEEKKYKEA